MKRVANTRKPPIVIPVVVVVVDIHIAIVIEVVERGNLCKISSVPPSLEYSQECI